MAGARNAACSGRDIVVCNGVISPPALTVGLWRGGRAGAEPAQSEAPTASCSDHNPCVPQLAGQSLAIPTRRDRSACHAKGGGLGLPLGVVLDKCSN